MMQQVESVFSNLDKARPTASPTSVLEDDPCAFMADWSWEASNTPLPPVSSSQAAGTTSPVCSSPLRSSSSSEDRATTAMQKNSNKTSRSLVETLQNCLTSLPQSTATMSEPSSTRPQPPSRPAGKRRPRASRRTPTKTIETEPGEFKDMVQKLTGIVPTTPAAPKAPAATAGGVPGVVPVRPRPQRANSIGPQTLRSIRRLPPMGPPPPPLLPLSRLRPSSDPIQALRSCKREFDQIDSGSTAPKRVMSAPLPSLLPSWCWDQDDESNNPPFAAMSTCSEPSPSLYGIDSQARENLLNVSPIDSQARENLLSNVSAFSDEQEFNFDPMLTSWLSVDSSSTSSPCAF